MPNALSLTPRGLRIFLVGIGVTLILVGLTPILAAYAQEATAEPAPVEAVDIPAVLFPVTGDPITPTGNNSYCLLCHNHEWRNVVLADGSVLSLYVPPEQIAGSVHGTRNEAGALGCVDCHGEGAFPHNQPTPDNARIYALQAVSMCVNCHQDQVDGLENGRHADAIRAGVLEAAICTDCHGNHNVQPVASAPNLVAGVCGDCHTETYTDWRTSAHNNIGPLGCGACHSPHSQQPRVGDTPDALCMNCHDEDNLPDDIFVHVQHQNSDYDLSCTSCHMFVEPSGDAAYVAVGASGDPAALADAAHSHSMVVETVACNTCHQALVASGEWTQLVSDNTTTDGTTAVETGAEAAVEAGEAAEAAEPTNYVPLLQGLILGLGFGATITAVFVARGNRARR